MCGPACSWRCSQPATLDSARRLRQWHYRRAVHHLGLALTIKRESTENLAGSVLSIHRQQTTSEGAVGPCVMSSRLPGTYAVDFSGWEHLYGLAVWSPGNPVGGSFWGRLLPDRSRRFLQGSRRYGSTLRRHRVDGASPCLRGASQRPPGERRGVRQAADKPVARGQGPRDFSQSTVSQLFCGGRSNLAVIPWMPRPCTLVWPLWCPVVRDPSSGA